MSVVSLRDGTRLRIRDLEPAARDDSGVEGRWIDVCGLEECTETSGVTRVGPDLRVRIVGDGPNDESASLLADSGIGEESFFLLDENDVFLAERCEIVQVGSGRDLLRPPSSSAEKCQW